ncbi:hypothetical protein [Granulicella tundricola]|uniref:hypothetical protein n=1 Tax=Granulicella tundricola TaxID=940615 RepID=UPI0012F875E7|nr:hypothetical protein [Granulicella tundricola]
MKRPLSRNRRIAVACASGCTIVATGPVLLGVTAAHSGISDFARGARSGSVSSPQSLSSQFP